MSRKSPSKSKPAASSKKKSPKARSAKAPGNSVYRDLARRTHELWREQLGVLVASPAALREMSKAMQPAFALFTQGLDLWLMVADPLSVASAFNGPAAPKNETKNSARKKSQTKNNPAPRTKSAAAGVGVGHPSMAELARRVAAMERAAGAGKASASSSKSSSSKTASVIGFEEAAGRRLGRRRKA